MSKNNMPKITVKKIQWPVGQGCFSSGSVQVDDDVFEYVYDCGSNNNDALRSCLAAYTEETKRIDVLFVSHLDSDHINGLDSLLVRLPVERIILPYLNNLEKIELLVKDVGLNQVSGNFLQFLNHPEEWFASRGVKEVIYVYSGDGKKPDIVEDVYEKSRWGDEERKFKTERKLRMEAGAPGITWRHRNTGLNVKIISDKIDFKVLENQLVWVFAPHVPNMPKPNLQAFISAVKNVLGRDESEEITITSVTEFIKSTGRIADLKACYRHIRSKHNSVSMLLYSGPAPIPAKPSFRNRYYSKPGWLGTGDSPLKQANMFLKAKERYEPFIRHIGTIMTPHHGSRHNFTNKLLKEFRPEVMFVSAASTGEHPHKEVAVQIKASGCEYHHISEDPASLLIERHFLYFRENP